MTEDDLLRRVCQLAAERHLLTFHCRDSRGSIGRGFPDLVIAGPEGTVFAELKGPHGTLTPDQRHWGSVLQKGGERWFTWRPRDLQAGVIEQQLDSIAAYRQLVIDR
jgi:hypothetical protein